MWRNENSKDFQWKIHFIWQKDYFLLAGIVKVFPYYFVLNETKLFVKGQKFYKNSISTQAHKIQVKIAWKLFIWVGNKQMIAYFPYEWIMEMFLRKTISCGFIKENAKRIFGIHLSARNNRIVSFCIVILNQISDIELNWMYPLWLKL